MKFDPEIVELFEHITATNDPELTIDFAYQNAERLFHEGKYFEAHEVLEFQWKKDFGPRKTFLQGLIQLSVSLHKIYVKPNGRGSRMQAEKAKEKFESLLHSSALNGLGKKETLDLLADLDGILGLYDGDELHPERVSAFRIPRIPKDWRELFRG
ncbi:DUF309 domain-containing protein [Leptospira kmetyi]|uniref:DUF309 domain-containing protein n=1 Tax=Leptospira kmetyi TaxID=408139 RepID=A0A2M9XT63_9LEPT|nr:DUF309 domain-containing protein [Leptospira kmetyi]AYV54564.1 DUF309 domain-containing protein [Leptospira kmetyi]EQA52506.1 PF03745 domain protein [Leptospira kmetyi serovar Malaysia str. Bejo-Iso9]PJZ30624.1 DUF309 domain-containing protein [Leptospira kmetyi]PJZ42490.1 DUF309 domain-containing protein [Leptospira kmetyi]TGK12763.1 DUF309 domain-containing protein [Leptospira kmetyi]